jgi:hypothetical protein
MESPITPKSAKSYRGQRLPMLIIDQSFVSVHVGMSDSFAPSHTYREPFFYTIKEDNVVRFGDYAVSYRVHLGL